MDATTNTAATPAESIPTANANLGRKTGTKEKKFQRDTNSFRPGRSVPVDLVKPSSLVFRIPSVSNTGTADEFQAVYAFRQVIDETLSAASLGKVDALAAKEGMWEMKMSLTPPGKMDDAFLSDVFLKLKDAIASRDFLRKGFTGGSPAEWRAYIGGCCVDHDLF